jgi:hypothetical protein
MKKEFSLIPYLKFLFPSKLFVFYIFIIFVVLQSCALKNITETCSIRYAVREGENISYNKQLLENAVSGLIKNNTKSIYSIEIIILQYSSGKELFTYDGEDLAEKTPDEFESEIEILLKIKKSGKLIKYFIFKASGNNDTELINNFKIELSNRIAYLCD